MRPPLQQVHPPLRATSTAPEWWVDLLQWRTHSPTGRGQPTAHGRWVALHGGQGSISLEYQTCTSPYPFDTLVTGMAVSTSRQRSEVNQNSHLALQSIWPCSMGSYAFNVCLTCECGFIFYMYHTCFVNFLFYAHHQNDSFPNTRS